MSQQPSEPATPQPSIFGGQVPRVVITPPSTVEETKLSAIQAELVDIIPASNRAVYRLTYNDGEFYRFGPTPELSRDPYAHAHLNPKRLKRRCGIKNCDYCNLCARYRIDPHALQARLVPEGRSSPKWDIYFHWVMNEQIPRLHHGNIGPGSRNWSSCWITGCPCRGESRIQKQPPKDANMLGCQCQKARQSSQQADGEPFSSACVCSKTGRTNGNEDVEYIPRTNGFALFPFEVCPIWIKRHQAGADYKKACPTCWTMEELIKNGSLYQQTRFTLKELDHNETLFRRIAFALSPLAIDPEPRPKEDWEDFEHCFFNFPAPALQSSSRSGSWGIPTFLTWN
ncbi:hypothetical protein AB5N19_10618 [Seiridium cardinale]